MFTKRTIIGIGVGAAIIAIGVASLVLHFGIQTIYANETIGFGEPTSYNFEAPQNTLQTMKVTGDTFEVQIESPADGYQIPLTTFKKEKTFDWVHVADGESKIFIQNTGSSEIQVEATFMVSTDPIFITYDIMVIVAGLVIIGFSLGFSIRKPRGF